MPTVVVRDGDSFTVQAWGDEDFCQLLEFLKQLQRDLPAEYEKIMRLIQWTADHGPPSNEEKCKNLEDKIWELKTGGGVRVFWFYHRDKIIICTHAFLKKQQKTPPKEIKKAKKIRERYLKETSYA